MDAEQLASRLRTWAGEDRIRVRAADMSAAADEIERLQAEVLYLRQMAQGLAHEEWGETLEPLFAKRLMAAANGVRCDTCKGTGRTLWGDSAMGSGIGGQTMTYGPCPGTNRSAANSNCPVWLAESDGA